MGDIGPVRKDIELEPVEPATEPEKVPTPNPEPEKVPA